jgi:hypothetical protein
MMPKPNLQSLIFIPPKIRESEEWRLVGPLPLYHHPHHLQEDFKIEKE